MNLLKRERLLKTAVVGFSKKEIYEMGDTYYVFYLLAYCKNYNSQELETVYVLLNDYKISNRIYFKSAISKFLNYLTCDEYNYIKNKTVNSVRTLDAAPLISEPIGLRKKIRKEPTPERKETHGDYVRYIDSEVELKVKCIETLIKVLQDEYKGNKRSELREIDKIIVWLEEKNETISNQEEAPDVEVIAKSVELRKQLRNHGFFELPKVSSLDKEMSEKLMQLFVSNKAPYNLAMLDYLGFVTHLIKEFKKKNKVLSDILGCDERAVRGNLSVLNNAKTTEDKERYTSYKYKKKVQIDYEKLK